MPTPRPPAVRAVAALACSALALATLAACGDRSPTGIVAPSPDAARASSSAAPAGPGLAVAFLAPLGAAPAVPHGTFDGTHAPVVELCRWTGSACDGAALRWTRTTGPAGEPLRVVTAEQHYRADWKERKDRAAGAVYRARVLLGDVEVGAGRLMRVLRPGETEQQVLAAGYAPISASQTVLLRFRLETSADYLAGAPGAPAASAIPRQEFVPQAADYSTGHPALPAAVLSHATLALVPKAGLTVAQLNALLAELGAERVGGIPGASDASGVLVLRLPGATHATMQATLERLRADARVAAAAQDARVEGDAIPYPALTLGHPWKWERTPGDGNWGLEAIRMPQLWNLNGAVARALAAEQRAAPLVGVLDGGSVEGHEDLAYVANRTPARNSRHGSGVAGIVGAGFDNQIGIDGANPFARLLVGAIRPDDAGGGIVAERTRSALRLVWDLYAMARDYPTTRVINVSQGYNWYKWDISMQDTTVRRIATAHGAATVEMLRTLHAEQGPLPVIVASAGNGSGPQVGVNTAHYSSPLTSAALVHGAAPVIVVEASGLTAGGGLARGWFSNVGGHVSAPGVQVLTTDSAPGAYQVEDGTSFAAPHVAALASYLYALAPGLDAVTLTSNPVRTVLTGSGTPAGPELAAHVDAFGAALQVDKVLGGERVLRTLVDIDDGTLDGNTRTNADGSDYLADATGDGRVDMRDFRRWRDWYLAAQETDGLALDGSARHPKKDVNGNRRWLADGDREGTYARGDFNGDGYLSVANARPVPGVMGNVAATDLDVLKRLFDDGPEGYAKAELSALLESADLTVVASSCLAQPGIARVRVKLYPAAGAVPLTGGRMHDAAHPARVYTVAVADGGYTAQAEALDAEGQVVARAERDFPMALGSDARWEPECLQVTPRAATVPARGTQRFTATMPGYDVFAVTWRAQRGTISPAGGYTAPGTVGAVDTIVATSVTQPGAEAYAVVTVGPGAEEPPPAGAARLVPAGTHVVSGASVGLLGSYWHTADTQRQQVLVANELRPAVAQASAAASGGHRFHDCCPNDPVSETNPSMTFSGSGDAGASTEVTPGSGGATTLTVSGQASGSMGGSSSHPDVWRVYSYMDKDVPGGGSSTALLQFGIQGGEMRYEATLHCTATPDAQATLQLMRMGPGTGAVLATHTCPGTGGDVTVSGTLPPTAPGEQYLFGGTAAAHTEFRAEAPATSGVQAEFRAQLTLHPVGGAATTRTVAAMLPGR